MRRRVSTALASAALEVGARPLVWRWVAGALVMLLAGVCVSVWIDDSIESGDFWGLTIPQASTIWLAGLVAGCIVRRWQAVLLALLPILVAIPFGVVDQAEVYPTFYVGFERVAYAMALSAPICAAFIAAGVIAAGAGAEPGRRLSSITALAIAVAALLSLLGAAAFSPDDGFVVASEPLWRIFVIAAYVSWVALPLLVLVASMRLVLGWAMSAARYIRSV